MALYVMADTHLSLAAEKPMDVFGSRWNGDGEKIRRGWTNTVSSDDTVIIPGDISWALDLRDAKDDLLFLDSLPGRKIIGKGNHDFWWCTARKLQAFFAEIGVKSISLLHNNAYLCEGRLICGSRGWFTDGREAPGDSEKLIRREAQRLQLSFDAADALLCADGSGEAPEKLCFLHFPPVFADQEAEPIIDVMVRNGVKRCFYGHVHSNYTLPSVTVRHGIEFHIVSSDYLSFVPYRID